MSSWSGQGHGSHHLHGRSLHSGASGSFKATGTEQTLGSHVVDLNNILGQGAYGIVFLGKHATTREPVAVKKLITSKEDGGRLALEEIKKYERLPPHPNIVKLLDYHFVDNAFWLMLEFCTDGTLEEFVCKNNPDEGTRLEFMVQCARAIDHMHSAENRMVHRDLKLMNIMLSRVGSDLTVKITDFGLAKDRKLSTSSQINSLVGSPAFIAPEILDKKPYDESVDIFSLGLVFLALIQFKKGDEMPIMPRTAAGPSPVPIPYQMTMAANQQMKQPVLVNVDKDDSARLQTVKSLINKMVVYDPKKRLSAAEVADTMESIAGRGGKANPGLRSRGAAKTGSARLDSGYGSQSLGKPGKPNVDEILREQCRKKAELEVTGSAVGRISQYLQEMPRVKMLEYGLRSMDSGLGSGSSRSAQSFSIGERVRIESDLETAMALQEGHGGWDNDMRIFLGQVGVIKRKVMHVFEVEFKNGEKRPFNPDLLSKLDGGSPASHSSFTSTRSGGNQFHRNDVVVINPDEAEVRRLQPGHGNWADKMRRCLGLKGIVQKVDVDGDVYVQCINQERWTFNPQLLTPANTDHSYIRKGSFVLVLDDYETVRGFQDDRHGNWNEYMRTVLGQQGTVKEQVTHDCVKVAFGNRTWTMNVRTLKHVATEGELIDAIMRKTL